MWVVIKNMYSRKFFSAADTGTEKRVGILRRDFYSSIMSIVVQTVLFCLFTPLITANPKPVLKIYNLSNFIDVDPTAPDVNPMSERSPTLKSFAEKYHCRVEYIEYVREKEMRKTIVENPEFCDVLCLGSDYVPMLKKAKLLSVIPNNKIPNIKYIPKKYYAAESTLEGHYMAPYLLGTVGLLYQRDMVGYPISGWRDYFTPTIHLLNRLSALDSAQSMFGAAFKYMGLSLNTTDKDMVREAGRVIYNIKANHYLGTISSDNNLLKSKYLKKELAMGIFSSGDAVALTQTTPGQNIEYVIPKEGCELFLNVWVVPRYARQKELAYQFLNYILKPDIQAAIATNLYYQCPNSASLRIIQKTHPEQLSNPGIYPTDRILKNCEWIIDQDIAEMERLWNRIVKD